MLVGVPKEIKPQENRVGLTPTSIREIIRVGGKAVVEKNAGLGIGISDQQYEAAGAEVVASSEEIFARADFIVKVKEPQPSECRLLRKGQILFTFLHLAPDPTQAQLLKESGVSAIAYETVTASYGGLPLLFPMSQIAGRLSIQAGAHCLEMAQGGRGVLLSGVPGVASGRVTILGGGVVGSNAARLAMGLGAEVTLIDKSMQRLNELDQQWGEKLNTIYATADALEYYVTHADLVIGAVLIPGAAAPKLVTRTMLQAMQPGSVVVDVAIDQGGCFETSHPTTHQKPTFVTDNVVHYCVANMPAAVARTATLALNNATLPFVLAIVGHGFKRALLDDPHLLNGLNVHQGQMTCKAVAEALSDDYYAARDVL